MSNNTTCIECGNHINGKPLYGKAGMIMVSGPFCGGRCKRTFEDDRLARKQANSSESHSSPSDERTKSNILKYGLLVFVVFVGYLIFKPKDKQQPDNQMANTSTENIKGNASEVSVHKSTKKTKIKSDVAEGKNVVTTDVVEANFSSLVSNEGVATLTFKKPDGSTINFLYDYHMDKDLGYDFMSGYGTANETLIGKSFKIRWKEEKVANDGTGSTELVNKITSIKQQ